jgi:hypothetical protein
MKEDLWTVQLEHFINQHPELDYEAPGLLAAGVMEQDSAVQDFATRTSHLQQCAGAVFPRSWVEAAFITESAANASAHSPLVAAGGGSTRATVIALAKLANGGLHERSEYFTT